MVGTTTQSGDNTEKESTELDTLTTENLSEKAEREIFEVKTPETVEGSRGQKLIVSLIVFLSLVCLMVGVVLVIIAKSKTDECESATNGTRKEVKNNINSLSNFCSLSNEAKKVGLNEFLSKVKAKYSQLFPNLVAYEPKATAATIVKRFKAYNASPIALKLKTDSALELLQEINNKSIDDSRLKLREKKALSQIKFFLKHNFGEPWGGNYYKGDWMMGPNFFCWMSICNVPRELSRHLPFFKPHSIEDLKVLKKMLAGYKTTFKQYEENMKLGVKSGMVRSVEECKAGLDAIKAVYPEVAQGNATGILNAKWLNLPEFLSTLTNKMAVTWYRAHGKRVEETIEEYLVEYLGVPIHQLLSYMEYEYSRHCVPSNVSSGLSNRPLPYIYTDGVANKSQSTTQRLPNGQNFRGVDAYADMLAFFTSTDMTADEVHRKGKEMLAKLYPEIEKLAMQYTKLNNSEAAVKLFKKKLKSQDMYYNKKAFPQNESSTEAYFKCNSVEGAMKYCPSRWKAISEWFDMSRQVMSLLDPKTVDLFYFAGNKHTTPNCPIELQPDFNPSSGSQSYEASNSVCSANCRFNVPFFLNNLGPIYSEFSVNAHEARPGHHTQLQGFREHFMDRCEGPIAWVSKISPNIAFGEGWGLYAESLIAQDTDAYHDNLLQKYGMYKWQIWRAIRLVVDTGLHAKGLTRNEALEMFANYAWDTSDVAQKEVTRYQSGPGQATSYMIGQLVIQKSREEAKKRLGQKFDLKEFHYQILSQGSAPLSFLQSHINDYVRCKLEPIGIGCELILNPPIDTNRPMSSNILNNGIEVEQSPSIIYDKRYL